MMRKTKTLGLALVAVVAMSAIAASAAQAGEISWEGGATKLTAEADPTGGGLQQFETTAGTIKCNETLNLAYKNKGTSECETGIEGFTPKIEMNGCNYKFEAGLTAGEMSHMEIEAYADIVCPKGKTIVINGGLVCKITIGSQNALVPWLRIKTGTTTAPEHITVEAYTTDITYNHNGLCGTNGTERNGIYRGNVIVNAETATKEARSTTVT
jgi:opacity protein-like surface antigen